MSAHSHQHYRKSKNYTIKNWHNATGYIQWRKETKKIKTNKQNLRNLAGVLFHLCCVLLWSSKRNKTKANNALTRTAHIYTNHLPLTIWKIIIIVHKTMNWLTRGCLLRYHHRRRRRSRRCCWRRLSKPLPPSRSLFEKRKPKQYMQNVYRQ